MIVVNLFGGPGSGKSTLAADLFVRFKRKGINAELCREPVKHFVYEKRDPSKYQLTLAATQYAQLQNMQDAGTEVAICDGPLLLGAVYALGLPYADSLKDLLRILHRQFHNLNVDVLRAVPYHTHARIQGTEAEAVEIDYRFRQYIKGEFALPFFHLSATALESGRVYEATLDNMRKI